MDNLNFYFVAAILLIQLYKIVRPALPKLGVSENVLAGADKALIFVYDVVPGLYRVVEALVAKGKIKPEEKWVEFLRLFSDQAEREGVALTNADKARAELLVKDLAAQDHQPAQFVEAVLGAVNVGLPTNPSQAPALAAASQ